MLWTSIRTPAPTVERSLLTLVLLCTLPIAFVAAWLIYDLYTIERATVIGNAVSRARAMSAVVDAEFFTLDASLRTLGTSHKLAQGQWDAFRQRAGEALPHVRADSIVVVDPSAPSPAPATVRDRQVAQRVLASGRTAVSDLFLDAASGQPLYTIGVPLRRGGQIALVLCATATADRLSTVLTEQKLAPAWRAAIVDSGGTVVARSHDIARFLGTRAKAPLLAHVRQADEGAFQSHSLDGVAVVTTYSRSPHTRWTVILGVPLAELNAGLSGTLLWLVIATVIATATGIGLALLMGRRIARSITGLLGPATQVGGAAALKMPPLYLREARVLGNALQDAHASLRRVQDGWAESNRRLALATDATKLGIWIRDLARDDIWASVQWRRLFGFAPQETIAFEAVLQRVHADDRAAVLRELVDTEGPNGEYDLEFRVVLPGGETRWMGARGRTEVDAQGQAALVRGVSFDITCRKVAELAVQQQQETIVRLSRLTLLGELSGAIAHEMNQPLTSILSNAQAAQRLLGRSPDDLDTVHAILADIVAENRRASEVILRLRRLFAKQPPRRELLDLHEVAREVVRLLRNDLINRGVLVRIAPAAVVAASADRVQMQQVLINLIMNASDAVQARAASERVIEIGFGAADGQFAQLFVRNHAGAAVSLERLFEPFYTTKTSGMGLGLSICRTIVNANGGRMWAEREANEMVCFHVCLPTLAQAA